MAQTRPLRSAQRGPQIKIVELASSSFELKIDLELQPAIRPGKKFTWPLLVSAKGPLLDKEQLVSFYVSLTDDHRNTVLPENSVGVRTHYVDGFAAAIINMPPIERPGKYYPRIAFGLVQVVREHKSMVIAHQRSIDAGRLEVYDGAPPFKTNQLYLEKVKEVESYNLYPVSFCWQRPKHVKFAGDD